MVRDVFAAVAAVADIYSCRLVTSSAYDGVGPVADTLCVLNTCNHHCCSFFFNVAIGTAPTNLLCFSIMNSQLVVVFMVQTHVTR